MIKKRLNNKERIFLLYPPISKKERYSSDIGNAGGEQIPLGIYSIAAYLREKGFGVALSDAEAEKLTIEQIVDRVKAYKPDYVGIGSTTVAFYRALEAASEIKKIIKVPVILGGPHVT